MMWVGEQREEVNNSLERKENTQSGGLCTLAEWLDKMGVQM